MSPEIFADVRRESRLRRPSQLTAYTPKQVLEYVSKAR